jgi:hypothetical protein
MTVYTETELFRKKSEGVSSLPVMGLGMTGLGPIHSGHVSELEGDSGVLF